MPKFHSRTGHDAIRIPLDDRHVDKWLDQKNQRIQLTNLGWVTCKVSEPWLGHISAVTVKQRAGKWFAVLTAIQVPAAYNKPARAAKVVHYEHPDDLAGIVAIDVGIAVRATCSDRTVLDHPQTPKRVCKHKLRYERRMARARDSQIKKMGLDPRKPIPKGTRIPLSNRAIKLKEVFSRQDAIHKLTTDLV